MDNKNKIHILELENRQLNCALINLSVGGLGGLPTDIIKKAIKLRQNKIKKLSKN